MKITLPIILLLSNCSALQPQISSVSVWDEVPGLANFAQDLEYVQLDSSS